MLLIEPQLIRVPLYTGNENYTGIASRDTANALRVLAHAVRGVAAGSKNTQTQEYILSTAQQVWTIMNTVYSIQSWLKIKC